MPEPQYTVLTIGETTVRHRLRYSPGHVLDEPEARALNLVLHENLRRNFRPKLDRMLEEGLSQAEIQSAFLTYSSGYAFGQGASPGLDPIEKLARKLARDAILVALRKAGNDPALLRANEIKAKDESWLEAQITHNVLTKPIFTEQARQRLADAQVAAGEVLAGFEMGD